MDFDGARQCVVGFVRSRREDAGLSAQPEYETQTQGGEDDTHFSVWETPPEDGVVLVGTPVWFVDKRTGAVTSNNPMYCRDRLAGMSAVETRASGGR